MSSSLSGGDGLCDLHQCWSDCGKNVHPVEIYLIFSIKQLKVAPTSKNQCWQASSISVRIRVRIHLVRSAFLINKKIRLNISTSRLLPTPDMFGFILFSLVSIGLSSQCEISVKNVGQVCCSGGNSKHLYFVVQKNFVWHISYAGNFDYEKELGPQDHDNYSCSCVPHDMEIRMPVSPELSPKISVNL